MRVIDVCCRWPGSSHDATMFANSILCEKIDRGDYGTDSIILGDSAYGPDYYICKPLENPVTHAEKRYQKSQLKTRNIAERTFGVLKRKFPCLAFGMHFRLSKVQDVVVACCVLYNITKSENDLNEDPVPQDEIDFQIETGRALRAAQQNQRAQQRTQQRTQQLLINQFFVP